MNGYADKDPEDSYDATDPVSIRLDVLERIIEALEEDPGDPRREARRVDALRLVAGFDDLHSHHKRRLKHIRHALRDM